MQHNGLLLTLNNTKMVKFVKTLYNLAFMAIILTILLLVIRLVVFRFDNPALTETQLFIASQDRIINILILIVLGGVVKCVRYSID